MFYFIQSIMIIVAILEARGDAKKELAGGTIDHMGSALMRVGAFSVVAIIFNGLVLVPIVLQIIAHMAAYYLVFDYAHNYFKKTKPWNYLRDKGIDKWFKKLTRGNPWVQLAARVAYLVVSSASYLMIS